jgi:hypothetical protein
MSEVLIGREPAPMPLRPPLIELAGVEMVYRTGWLLGVPLAYLLARAIGWATGQAFGLDIAFVFWRTSPSRSPAR